MGSNFKIFRFWLSPHVEHSARKSCDKGIVPFWDAIGDEGRLWPSPLKFEVPQLDVRGCRVCEPPCSCRTL